MGYREGPLTEEAQSIPHHTCYGVVSISRHALESTT